MLIPRYWSRAEASATTPEGKSLRFFVWRGSRSSTAEAQALADEAAKRAADRIRQGEGFPDRYTYTDRALREEAVQELSSASDSDTPEAAITRNAYGALVLNTTGACFVDVDLPEEAHGRGSPSADPSPSPLWSLVEALPLPPTLRSLAEQILGPRPSATPAERPRTGDVTAAPLTRVRDWVSARPESRLRIYRTHSGLRYLVLHDLFSPADRTVQDLMTAVGADPKYVQLCRVQQSFRARLTPKPWRVGQKKPPARFPFDSPAEERAMRDWEARYERATQGYATCHLVEEIGSGTEHPQVTALRTLHDEHTRAATSLPLA